MSNPWTKKNPFMSLWLSAANQTVGRARGTATRAAKRSVAAAQADATQQIIDFWTGKSSTPVARKKPRR